jgi:hypothetical protein
MGSFMWGAHWSVAFSAWTLPAKSFSSLGPLGLMTLYYSLNLGSPQTLWLR